jgi:hypothetical protein
VSMVACECVMCMLGFVTLDVQPGSKSSSSSSWLHEYCSLHCRRRLMLSVANVQPGSKSSSTSIVVDMMSAQQLEFAVASRQLVAAALGPRQHTG